MRLPPLSSSLQSGSFYPQAQHVFAQPQHDPWQSQYNQLQSGYGPPQPPYTLPAPPQYDQSSSYQGYQAQHEDINLKENQIATASTGDEPDEAVALDLAVSTGAPAGRKFSDARLAIRCQWWMQLEQSHQGMDQRRESPWTRFEKPKSNLLIFQRTPVQVRAGTGQGYHRIYIGVRTIPGPSGSVFYFVPKDPNDNSKGGIARIGQHQNMLPPPRTFMTSPDDWRPSSQGRQLWMYDYGVVRLKEQKMDWLSQTGTIMDAWPLG
ncbi:hypothetical protein H2202_002724 [Exophiala xenobiotica]|nr:hypothetical protein H2202_002724 [Exophiala xenobiotica]